MSKDRCWPAIVVVVACLGVSAALWWGVHETSHRPAPGKTEASEKPKHESTENAGPTAGHKEITATPPFTIKVVSAHGGEDNPDVTGENHKWSASPDWWVAIFTGGLTFVTAVLAAFTYCLWRSTSRLVQEGAATARLELRAYIGHMSKVSGAHFETASAIDSAM